MTSRGRRQDMTMISYVVPVRVELCAIYEIKMATGGRLEFLG